MATGFQPFNEQAEQSVLSSLFISKESIAKAASRLKPEDFYFPAHKDIYESILGLFNREAPVDFVLICEELKSNGVLETCGGSSYIAEIAAISPTTAQLDHHIEIVKDKSLRRKILSITKEIDEATSAEAEETEKILQLAEQSLYELSEGEVSSGFFAVSEIMQGNIKRLNEIKEGKLDDIGVLTGYPDLDKKLQGMQKDNLILIAARPSMGKTSFALNIAQNAAKHQNATVAIFSLEMSKEELANKLWSSESMVELKKIKGGQGLTSDEWKYLLKGAENVSQAPIYINDNGSPSLTEIRSLCKKLKREKGLDLVILDHIQLMSGTRKTENRTTEVADISRNLKLIAKDLEVPVVCLSQLNRGPEGRTTKKPMLSDLKESGAIEQDADIVMLIYREDYYDPASQNPGVAEIIVAKNRNGETGTINLRWVPQFTTFRSIEQKYGDED